MRQCKHCACFFEPVMPMQAVCSPQCAAGYVKAKRKQRAAEQKRERAKDRAKLQALKPLRKCIQETQAAFNAYVRERDRELPCVSCGRFHQGAWDAGHYLSAGARPELRFHEDNCHRQCVPCNQHKSGNLIAYRKGLIQRIGVERVLWLEGPHAPRKWTREELGAMKADYRARFRELRAQRTA